MSIMMPDYHRQLQDAIPRWFPEWVPAGATRLITRNITFVVTEACPLRCTYCYECNKNHDARMTREVAKAAIDRILSGEGMDGYIDLDADKSAIFEFIGGEPLLEADLMVYIADYIKQQMVLRNHPWRHAYMFSVSTNGVPWRDPKFKEFLIKNPERVSLSITIDGDRDLHDACRVFPDGRGSYADAVDALAFTRRYADVSATKVTLAPGNIARLGSSIPHLFDLGFTEVNANCVYEEGWTLDDARVLYRELVKLADWMVDTGVYERAWCSLFDPSIGRPQGPEHTQNWCGGNGQMLAIGPDGNLYPCLRFMKQALSVPGREPYTIGHTSCGIVHDEKLDRLTCVTRQSQSEQKCLDCPVSSGCGWCTGLHYDLYGTPDKRATFICWMHKARCMASAYYWDRILQKTGIDVGAQDNVSLEDRAAIREEHA